MFAVTPIPSAATTFTLMAKPPLLEAPAPSLHFGLASPPASTRSLVKESARFPHSCTRKSGSSTALSTTSPTVTTALTPPDPAGMLAPAGEALSVPPSFQLLPAKPPPRTDRHFQSATSQSGRTLVRLRRRHPR